MPLKRSLPFNWLAVFTFTGATFLYTKMDFTAVIKEKACKFGFFWRVDFLVSLWSKLSSTRWTTSQKACISLSLVPLNREKGSRFNLLCCSKGWRCWLHYFVASRTAFRLLAFFSNSELPLCCISTYTLEAQLNHTHSSLNWIPPWMVGSCSSNHKTISRSISKGEHKRVEQRRSDVDPALQWDVVVMLLLPIFRIEWTSVTWQRADEGWKTASLYPTWTSPSHHEPSTVSGILITVGRLGISWNHDHQPQMFHLHPPIHICYIRLLQLDNEVNPLWSGACQQK